MIIAVEVLLILVVLIGFYVVSKLDQLQHPDMGEGDTSVNEGIEEDTVATMSGYTTVALFGLDTRESGQLGKGNRSDTIIIASINNDTGEVRLASVFRDTYLDMTTGKFNKANSAYSTGGPEQAIKMLNKNLDLTIEKYISVDFAAMTDAVDLLGGIDIDVDEAEIDHLNNYMVETSKVTGVSSKPLTHTGLQTLDGVQATSYCRIRYTTGDDYKRTERQRTVLNKILEKVKTMPVTTLVGIVNDMFDHISTSLTLPEIIDLAKDVAAYNLVDTTGFPFNSTPMTLPTGGDCVVPVNLANNVLQLHQWMYGSDSYDAVSSTVQEISDHIINETGAQ